MLLSLLRHYHCKAQGTFSTASKRRVTTGILNSRQGKTSDIFIYNFCVFFFGYFSTERANQFHHITSQANTNFQTDIIDHMQLYLFMLVHIYVNGQDKHFIQIHLCFVFNFKWKISGNVSIADGVQHWFLKFCCSVNCKELKSFGKAQYYWKFNFNVDSEIEV